MVDSIITFLQWELVYIHSLINKCSLPHPNFVLFTIFTFPKTLQDISCLWYFPLILLFLMMTLYIIFTTESCRPFGGCGECCHQWLWKFGGQIQDSGHSTDTKCSLCPDTVSALPFVQNCRKIFFLLKTFEKMKLKNQFYCRYKIN